MSQPPVVPAKRKQHLTPIAFLDDSGDEAPAPPPVPQVAPAAAASSSEPAPAPAASSSNQTTPHHWPLRSTPMPQYSKPTYDLSSTSNTPKAATARDALRPVEHGAADATPLSWKQRWVLDNADLMARLFSAPAAGTRFSLNGVEKEATRKGIRRLEKSRSQGSVNWSQSLPEGYTPGSGIPEPPPFREWENHFPFDVREAPHFAKECKRRLSDVNCPKVECYGKQRPFICLYGLPCAPKETVYETDPFDRAGCIGFATSEAAASLVNLVQSGSGSFPAYAGQFDTERVTTNQARFGGHNLAYSIDGANVDGVLPGTGFWADEKLPQNRFQPHKILKKNKFDAKTARKPDSIRKMLVNVARKTGLYVRAPLPPSPKTFERQPAATQSRAEKKKTKQGFPLFYATAMETYTALVAAALGIHPPIYAMILVGFGFSEDEATIENYYKKGYQPVKHRLMALMVMERGLAPLDTQWRQQPGSTRDARASISGGVPFPVPPDPCFTYMNVDNENDPNYFRRVINVFLARRLSDRVAEAANEFLIHADIKPDNMLLKKRYGRIESNYTLNYTLTDTEFDMGSETMSIWWLPSDIYLIDFAPTFASFLPRPLSSYPRYDKDQARAWRNYLEYRTDAGARTVVTSEFASEAYTDLQAVVQPECLRLIMLLLMILGGFTSYRQYYIRESQFPRLKQEFTQIYGQIYHDIMNILKGKGSLSFGALCTSLFTGSLQQDLFVKPDTDKEDPLYNNLLKGFNLVKQVNDHDQTLLMWSSIAKQMLRMFHHYVFNPVLASADDLRLRKVAIPVVFKDLHLHRGQRHQLRTKGEVIVSIAIVMGSKYYVDYNVQAKIQARIERVIRATEIPGVDRHNDEVKAPQVSISANPESSAFTRLIIKIKTATALEAPAMQDFLLKLIQNDGFLPSDVQKAYGPGMTPLWTVKIQSEDLPPSFAAAQQSGAWNYTIQERLVNQVVTDDADRGRYNRNMLLVVMGFLGMGIEFFYGSKQGPGLPQWDSPYVPERAAGDDAGQMQVEEDKGAVVNPFGPGLFGPSPFDQQPQPPPNSVAPYNVPSPDQYQPPNPESPRYEPRGASSYEPFEAIPSPSTKPTTPPFVQPPEL